MTVTLADELLLLAYDDAGSAVIDTSSLDLGLAGALLVELALAGRVGVVDKRVVVTDPLPTGEPIADAALATIAADAKRRKPEDWVNRLDGGLRQQLLGRLVDAGVLRRDEDKVLWVFPRTRYPSTTGGEPAVEADARHRVEAALAGTGPVDARTAALCALIKAVGLERAFPDRPAKEVRKRLGVIAEGDWASTAVRKAIGEMQAAVAVVITSAAIATTATNT
ncbi:GOLPH3/VPS74 family protein [Planosporangium mesophilum]|uniref:GPP34 family phosphoprotein n=1 Tax=Planosporangium mesophilum TaxID=689768 RepID=A0A8J3X1I1_9ACTN|nr:GPP34 family phosphoprotein [Planosporangium mesophilum]NJC84482.1 GPP34 family phosphoprotein [Planosporangium mesophilum]GII23374.1 hypothetical protein Pme01_29710 [Planosporangium mesophilum]